VGGSHVHHELECCRRRGNDGCPEHKAQRCIGDVEAFHSASIRLIEYFREVFWLAELQNYRIVAEPF
jgi:hypothetical protein